MKKLALCICHDTKNYGSMLQAKATLIQIEERGIRYDILNYKKQKNLLFIIKSLPRLFNPIFVKGKFRGIRKKIKLKKYHKYEVLSTNRDSIFKKYMKDTFTHLTNPIIGYDELRKKAVEYDAFLVGSDQLWLPSGLASGFYTLEFTPKNAKRISYSTSFGVSELPNHQKNRYKDFLEKIDFLSVRETQGKKIVNDLTDKQCEVVLDPTLLLDAKQWDKYIPQEKIITGKYIFCYFLGKNEEHRDVVERFAKYHNMKIVTLPFLDDFVKRDLTFGDIQKFDVGPNEFVNLIRYAEYIFTDSFHGSVFSILNHKKFIVFNRFNDDSKGSRNSRIESICNLLGLEQRRYSKTIDISQQVKTEIDYESVDERLKQLRKSSIDFLNRALNIFTE